MQRAIIPIILLFLAVILTCQSCGNIEGLSLPYVASPRVEVATPASPAEGNIAISFQLIDREVEPADVTVEFSTNGGTTYSTATLTVPGDAVNLASAWHPGKTHSVTWNSVTDMVGRSGAASVCVKITPSDVSNPSGTPGISRSFTVNNIAYNEAPTATAASPAGVQTGNIQINYFLADVESDTCSIAVLYSTNDGTSWQAATMGPAGDGISGLSSSPSGTAHVYLWDSRADNVALSGQVDTIKIRITPTDFNAGTAGDTNSFSVDNSVANNPPTVNIETGPADGSTIATTQVTFTWSGSDTDGTVVGYYYSFDHDPPDVWTTDTTVTSGALSEAAHTFRVVAVDDDSDLSTVASRSFTVSITGTITAQFSGSAVTGPAPLDVSFSDLSTATNGITTWSWDFGNGDVSTAQHPVCSYVNAGNFSVSLTVTGPDGTDTETKTNYITVTSSGGDTIYVDDVGGDDGKSGLDWPNAVQTIQTGLDKASDNWTVIVADGTYTGTSNKNLDFAGKAIHLKSVGGAAACTIDCENNGRGFYFHNSETNDSVVDGFTIQNGSVSGVYCGDYCSPTIRNCTIANNSGCGIFYLRWCNGVVTDCVITNNSAENGGGICWCFNGNPRITGCTITSNSANMSGGAINLGETLNGTIAGCTITGNFAGNDGGGITWQAFNGTIANCLIANNEVDGKGGGLCCWYNSTPTIVNCTITGNIAKQGGGISCGNETSTPILANTILWGNTATFEDDGNEIFVRLPEAGITLNCCDYADNSLDPRNVDCAGTLTEQGVCIHLDPQFENATAQDYHLDTGSPCIDVGDNSLIPPGVTTDLDGNVRIHDGDGDTTATVDIGAYEFGSNPPASQYCWTYRMGGSLDDDARAICVDGSGNVYMAGAFASSVNFAADWGGSDTRASAGYGDIFVTKIDSSGSYSWTRRIGGSAWDEACSICTDADGNVYVAGNFEGSVNFAADWSGSDTKNSAGECDIFVTKIDSSGSYSWTRRMGGSLIDKNWALCTDAQTNVYVAGYFYGSVNFLTDWSGSDVKNSAGACDIFITKIDSAGSYSWTRRMGGSSYDSAFAICTDQDRNVYVAGNFFGSANFAADWSGSDTKNSAGELDIFVTKIDSAGSYSWTRRMGGSDWDEAYAVCTDAQANVYVAGTFQDSVDFATDWGGSDTKTSAGTYDIFILKIDSSGSYSWTHGMGGSSDDYVRSVCTDANSNVYMTGDFESTVNFAADWSGSDTKNSAGECDIFVTKIDSAGSYSWTRRMGGVQFDRANTICADTGGNVYMAGYFDETVNFADDWGSTDEKQSAGRSDTCVVKLRP